MPVHPKRMVGNEEQVQFLMILPVQQLRYQMIEVIYTPVLRSMKVLYPGNLFVGKAQAVNDIPDPSI
ncbi:hypothetical protein D3C81_1978500 [compost metagenome]